MTHAASPSASGTWDEQWKTAWKVHAANPWFAYEADVYRARLFAYGNDGWKRALKTDAFDEACGRFHLLGILGAATVVLDVSPQIVSQAARRAGGRLSPCVSDVRSPSFRTGSFDLVLSPSSLDHFDDRRDIEVALRALRRLIEADGRLLVALDNPTNPVLRIRRAIHRMTGPVGGVIPFLMGSTLARPELLAALERAGYTIVESGYMVHAPRIVGLWIGEWLARRGRARAAERFRRLLGWLERALVVLPTRRWTGHFVFAECRRRTDAAD
jgi:SAM-dependent methyltransferase